MPRPDSRGQPDSWGRGGLSLAERRDHRLGIREVFKFIGVAGRRVAVISQAPLEGSRGAVLICSPILGDFHKNYRREVGLGRLLASRGFAAYRFHYRGCGNSDGVSAETTFQTMCEDAEAVRELVPDLETVAFVGTRIGALVAAHVASSVPGAPLALVEPTVRPASFYREGFRARMMRDLKDMVTEKPSTERLLAELEDRGVLDVFGYPVDRNLFHSTQPLNLEDEIPRDTRRILLVQMGGDELRAEYRTLQDKLAQQSVPITTEVHGKADAWWFVDDEQPSLEVGLELVAEWLSSVLGAVK